MAEEFPTGYRCPNCGWIQTHTYPDCYQCGYEDELDETKLSNTGTILSSSVVRDYEGRFLAVYAIVLLDSGGELLVQVDDCTILHPVDGIPIKLTSKLRMETGEAVGHLWRGALLL